MMQTGKNTALRVDVIGPDSALWPKLNFKIMMIITINLGHLGVFIICQSPF